MEEETPDIYKDLVLYLKSTGEKLEKPYFNAVLFALRNVVERGETLSYAVGMAYDRYDLWTLCEYDTLEIESDKRSFRRFVKRIYDKLYRE